MGQAKKTPQIVSISQIWRDGANETAASLIPHFKLKRIKKRD